MEEVKLLPIASIVMTKQELQQAISNIARGYPAFTEGAVEVAYLPRYRKYQLVNGYHRMVANLLADKTNILCKIQEADWRLPPKKDCFIFRPEMPYKGLENFIKKYELKRL